MFSKISNLKDIFNFKRTDVIVDRLVPVVPESTCSSGDKCSKQKERISPVYDSFKKINK